MWWHAVLLGVLVQLMETYGVENYQDSNTRINRPVMRSTENQNVLSGVVTCSCNLPPCVLTGYMCKSTLGVCFEDLPPHGHGHGLYGCINDERHTSRCREKLIQSESETTLSHNENKSRFSCCYKDMCNHADMTIIIKEPQGIPQKQYYDADHRIATNSNDEVLFKVATIAVPICGCIILLLLILLAIKILRTESGFNNKFGAGYCKKHSCHNSFSSSPSHNNYQYHDVLLPHNHKNHPEYHIIESRELLPLPRVFIDPQLSPTLSTDMSKNETHARLNYLNDYCSLMPHKNAMLYEKDVHKYCGNVENNLATTSSADHKKVEYNLSCSNVLEIARNKKTEFNELKKENSDP